MGQATINTGDKQVLPMLSTIQVLLLTLSISVLLYAFHADKSIDILSLTAVPVTLFFLLLFISKLGHGFPVKEIMVLLTAVQFLYSPFLAYFFYPPDPIYPMEVSADEYFGYAVPAVLLFAAGLYVLKISFDFENFPQLIEKFNIISIGKQLVIIGLVVDLISSFLPASLAFFLVLIGYWKFIGAYYLFFSDYRYKSWWIAIAFIPLILGNLSQGMFHELLLWALFSFMLYFIKHKKGFLTKVMIVLFAFVSIYNFNLVKKTYRDITWNDKVIYSPTDKLMIFGQSIISVVFGEQDNLDSTAGSEFNSDEHNLTRLNQGVIVTRIMNHTGKQEPFANGETIHEAIEAALVPRFLNPDKVRSGGRDTYTRFTGYRLGGNTSISLSLLGEGYANYGYGGIYFMFFLGLFYSYVLWLITSVAHRAPYLLLWIPFLFLPVVKAEEGFETVLNYIFKSSFVLWFLYMFYLKKISYQKEEEGIVNSDIYS